MALTDIVFYESDDQSMILKLPTGTLDTPVDMLIDTDEFMYLLTLEPTGGSPYFAFIS